MTNGLSEEMRLAAAPLCGRALLLERDVCPAGGRRKRLHVRCRGEFSAKEERLALPFSNLTESMSVEGPF